MRPLLRTSLASTGVAIHGPLSTLALRGRVTAFPAEQPRDSEQANAAPSGSCETDLSRESLEWSWRQLMGQRYGEGNYALFRPLYKDLCDEMRREYATKPPPPLSHYRHPSPTSAASEDGTQTVTDAPSAASQWSVRHEPLVNLMVFTRPAQPATRQARVVAYSPVELHDPARMNAVLTFADWCPIEVLLLRRGVILHFSIASNEGGMHMRNVRAYDAEAHPGAALMDCNENAVWVRQNLFYDGPCLWHLELDVQNELYDVMQDHDITLDWVRWVAQWVHYQEHVNYVRWSLQILEELIPSANRGSEDDFLLQSEKALLDSPSEDWLDAHHR